jgi:alpha-1,3-rhamnosyl/mannosyltransferase
VGGYDILERPSHYTNKVKIYSKSDPMRLAFNATALLTPLTGIGQYGFHLAGELLKMPELDIDFFYGTTWDKRRLTSIPSGVGQVVMPWMKPWMKQRIPFYPQIGRLYRQHQFTKQIKAAKFDVHHEPNYLPLRMDVPTVITAHDLSWIRYPEMHPAQRVAIMNRYFEKALYQASAVITDAEFVKQEIVDVFGIQPEKITAIPLGVESMFRPLSSNETRAVLSLHGLEHGRYFLTVGTLEPRKNLSVAIRAYSELPEAIRKRYPLVVIGMKGWHSAEIEKLITPLERAGYLRVLGYVSRQDLATIMAGATSLIYPSIYEGFGLPPLEAMACGVPVICSNVSSLPEVVGDAGILIDPRDETGLREHLHAITEDKKLWVDLSMRARERSLRFTWKNCAQQTIEVYKNVCG